MFYQEFLPFIKAWLLKHFSTSRMYLPIRGNAITVANHTGLRLTQSTKKQCPFWPTGREVMTTSSCWVRGYNSTPSPTVQSTPVIRTVERDSAVSG